MMSTSVNHLEVGHKLLLKVGVWKTFLDMEIMGIDEESIS